MSLCTACIHYRAPAPVELFSSRRSGMLHSRAATEWEQIKARREDVENRRVDDPEYEFVHPPEFHAWCHRHVLDPDLAETVQRALRAQNLAPFDRARADGMHIRFNPVSGELLQVYELCERKNAGGRCPDFEARQG